WDPWVVRSNPTLAQESVTIIRNPCGRPPRTRSSQRLLRDSSRASWRLIIVIVLDGDRVARDEPHCRSNRKNRGPNATLARHAPHNTDRPRLAVEAPSI